MKVKVVEGKKIKINKKDIISLIESHIRTEIGKKDDIVDIRGVENVEVMLGKVTIEEIDESELLSKSIKQILKSRGYNIKNITVEPIKEKGKK